MRSYLTPLSIAAVLFGAAVVAPPAHSASEFRSPTSNIICGWTAAGEFLRVQTLLCATRNDKFVVIFPANARARSGYTSLRLPDAPRQVLRYGRTWRHGAFRCSMHRLRGVTCRNGAGRSFTLNRDQFTRR